jgi:hypothetical protein
MSREPVTVWTLVRDHGQTDGHELRLRYFYNIVKHALKDIR